MEVKASSSAMIDKDAYLEELIVRKELSDNFLNYNDHYDTFHCLPAWSKRTLDEHRWDRREYTYKLAEFERAETHDELWNAAQRQMLRTGTMHGYMRMYWAKKILEWSASPEEAFEAALALTIDMSSTEGIPMATQASLGVWVVFMIGRGVRGQFLER